MRRCYHTAQRFLAPKKTACAAGRKVKEPVKSRKGEVFMLKTYRQERGFTLVELLVVIAIISVIAGVLIPTLMSARGRADLVACQSNLRELQKLGMIYADSSGTRFYPLAKGSSPQAHESLQLIVNQSEGLNPKMFTCATWRDGAAEVVDEKFQLSENTCSYTWPKRRLSPSDKATLPLSCDKYVYTDDLPNGHKGRRNVVYLGGNVEEISTEVLPAEELPKDLVR